MNLLRHLPNALTLCNLFFGVWAIMAIHQERVSLALILFIGALIADALDGALARRLGIDGPLGIQLDSLADMVTFGALPAFMLYYIGIRYGDGSLPVDLIEVLAALSAVSAGLRLGRFNIDVRPKEYFHGLATPAGGILVASWLWAHQTDQTFGLGADKMPFLLILVPVFLAIFYQVGIKLPGLKSPKGGLITLFVLTAVIVLGFFLHGAIAVFLGIILYILLGIVNLGLRWF